MAEAKLNLGYTRVVAPISGVTSLAAKSNGSLVTTADSLLTTIVQTDPLYINFSVPEADFLKMNREVRSGSLSAPSGRNSNGSISFEVSFKLADGSVFPTKGKMNFVSERVNPNTGGFDARAQVPNPDGDLRPGQFVRVILGGATRKAALAVPQRAVVDTQMGKLVFTVSPDNKLVAKPVELDAWLNGEWVVTKGLQAGDRVMVDGVIKAHTPGMVVTPAVLDANTAARPPQATAPQSSAAGGAGTNATKTTEPPKKSTQ
jgi:membrane fusion protein, multidrug efflux system